MRLRALQYPIEPDIKKLGLFTNGPTRGIGRNIESILKADRLEFGDQLPKVFGMGLEFMVSADGQVLIGISASGKCGCIDDAINDLGTASGFTITVICDAEQRRNSLPVHVGAGGLRTFRIRFDDRGSGLHSRGIAVENGEQSCQFFLVKVMPTPISLRNLSKESLGVTRLDGIDGARRRLRETTFFGRRCTGRLAHPTWM
ncbi:MAG: hypothetical protein ACK4XJ_07995 [Fimbriimonadaceae bacterium]